jgi:hypothetical protein
MEFSSVRLGARIEFYEDLEGPDRRPRNYVGAAFKDDAFAGAGVPSAGDRVSVVSLVGGMPGGPPAAVIAGGSPFLPVAYVEHYLIPVDEDGEVPTWWKPGFTTPSANPVFHVRARRDGGYGEKMTLTQSLAAQGWQVDRAVVEFEEGSD